jgi:DMSO reductase anchor subunit
VKSPRSTRMRHRQWRELFETFTLFFSLTLLLLCAGFVMRAIKAPDLVTIMVILFALPCFVASVLKSICYFAHWVEQVGLPEDRDA